MFWATFQSQFTKGLRGVGILSLSFLSACAIDVPLNDVRARGITFTSLEELTYDSSLASIRIRGNNYFPDSNPLTTIRFHSDSACSSSPLGEGPVRTFIDPGIVATVPSVRKTEIYASNNTNENCVYITTYDPLHLAPPPPLFLSFDPASPSTLISTPRVFGEVSGNTVGVRIYDDSNCNHLIASGTADEFTTVGIGLILNENQETAVYGRAIEPFGNGSTCAYFATYVHDAGAIDGPELTSVIPISPSRSSTTPRLSGNLPDGGTQIKFYSDPGCKTEIKSGTSSEFSTTGVELTVAENNKLGVWAKNFNDLGHSSFCTYLTTFQHDNTPPAEPGFLTTTPLSPSGSTLYPKVKGALPTDATQVRFFNNRACTVGIGAGPRADYLASGIPVSVTENDTTVIYGAAIDAAGNASRCVELTTFVSDTIPPDLPVYAGTDPTSPTNKSFTPKVQGGVSADTESVSLFSDIACQTQIGTGSAGDFIAAGIQVTAGNNVPTTLYAKAYDVVGNGTECTYLTTYDHSTAIPPAPVYLTSNPATPTNVTNKPFLIGSLSPIITQVQLFADDACQTMIGSGTARNFKSTGIGITVGMNAVTPVYSKALDKYGNESLCTFFVNYTHTNIIPSPPVFQSYAPPPPTRMSSTPTIKGLAPTSPVAIIPSSRLVFYDSQFCVNRIGMGSAADFQAAGIQINAGVNSVTNVHARTFDDAGNGSPCTNMSPYTHDNLLPGRPLFISSSPASPSYSRQTFVKGYLGPTSDFLPASTVTLFSDSACTQQIGHGPVGFFTSVGIEATMLFNTVTTVYGFTTNIVGSDSTCSYLTNFLHAPEGGSDLMASPLMNGSVILSWLPDFVANPPPEYHVKRSTRAGGPYTTIQVTKSANFKDVYTTHGETYYYIIVSTNSTGKSVYSNEASAKAETAIPIAPTALSATPGWGKISLDWQGDIKDLTYTLYRSFTPGGPYQVLASQLTTSSYVDSTAPNDQAAYYVVKAVNPLGVSPASSEASAMAKDQPPAPTGLTATWARGACSYGQHGVLLTWSSPAYQNGFFVNFGTVTGGTQRIARVTGNSYLSCMPTSSGNIDSNYPLPPDFEEYYTVAADWGGYPGAQSNEVVLNHVQSSIVLTPGNGEMVVDWTPAGNAPAYILRRSLSPNGPWTTLGTITGTTYYLDSTVTNGTAYYYTVEPEFVTGVQYGILSSVASAIPGPNPAAPTNLKMIISSNRVYLRWTAPDHYTGFNVYSATASGGPWTLRYTAPTNEWQDLVPQFGMNYYRVTTRWGQSYESAPTANVSFRNGVSNLINATATSSAITVTWNSVVGASKYILKRSTSSRGTYSVVSSNAVSPFTDSTVTADTAYYYVVVAEFSDTTQGQESAETSAMAGNGKIPSGLTVTSVGPNTVNLTWGRVTGASGYKIYWGMNNNGPYDQIPLMSSSNSISIPSLNPDSTYYFKITSFAPGESSRSVQIAATTRNAPSAPLAQAGNTSVKVDWGGVSGVSGYNVQRSTDGTNFTTIASNLSTFTLTDTGLTNGQIYFYRIVAIFSNGSQTSPNSLSVTPGVIPMVPGGLAITGNSNGTDVTLYWTAVTGASGYGIYLYNAGTYTSYGFSSNNSEPILGLTEGTPVTFAVTSLNGTNESAYSALVTVIPSSSGPAPSVTMSGSAAQITWTSASFATSYTLERSEDSINFTSIASGVTGLSYSDSGVNNGQAYFYRYRAEYGGGQLGAPSATSDPVTPGNPLLTPANLIARASDVAQVTLQWVQSPNALSYNIYRGSTPGGPYVFKASVPSTETSYIDNTVIPGSAYYYVVTSVNDSGVNSTYSNEAGVDFTVTVPSGLAAIPGNGTMQVTWNAAGGASQYYLYRSLTPGGAFMLVYSGATPSFTDPDIRHGLDYYYSVAAKFTGAGTSHTSAPVMATGVATLDLTVPIELTDQPLASDQVEITFDRTQTTFDPDDYDGTRTYYLETVAINLDSNQRSLKWVGVDGTELGEVPVPGNTATPTLFRNTLSIPSGVSAYRLKLSGTAEPGQLQVLSARLLVKQVGATRSKLYFPLLSKASAPNSADSTSPVFSTLGTSYETLPVSNRFTRHLSAQSNLGEFNSWELEAVVAGQQDAIGTFALRNLNQNALVEDSQTYFRSDTLTVSRVPISEGLENFSSANEGDEYDLVMRCDLNCTSEVRIYKAGLWLKVQDLSKVEVVQRLTLGATYPDSPNVLADARGLVDASGYSNPSYGFSVTALAAPLTFLNLQLSSSGTSDSDTTGLNAIPGSGLFFGLPEMATMTTPMNLPLVSGHRMVVEVTPTAGSVVRGASLVIQGHR